jgi:two-component system phosphate regulon sensor histidine kinase PhoR
MAFACEDIVTRKTALIGGVISTTVLTYLRLREDALAHFIAEEQDILDQAKRLFVQRLAHDLRHPVETLKSTVSELEKSLPILGNQLEHLTHVVDDTILAIEGRDPEKLVKPKKRPDKVSEFLADIRFYFKRRFEEAKKSLEVISVDPRWEFSIDRGMLHEILENLILNALEHGGNNVQISVEKKNGKYFIQVKDDGTGIPNEDRERIFRPYYKGIVSVKEGRIRGRGLAIARMLAKAHGGDVWLKPGGGEWRTDFVVEVPEK